MTDRAEPGVTPLTDADIAAFRDCEPYVRPVDWRRAGPNDGQVVGRIVPEWLFLRFLDAATPRPGLVEREINESEARTWDRHHRQECQERSCTLPHRLVEFYRDFVYCKPVAALASGTGEPGLDVADVHAADMAASLVHDYIWQRPVLSGTEPPSKEQASDAIWTIHRVLRRALANDKGADPTPEPTGIALVRRLGLGR